MYFVIVLVCTAVAVWVFRKPLKKAAVAFYAVGILLTALYVAGLFVDLPAFLSRPIFILMQKCTLALALFAVVMFIGVFPRDSRLGQGLRPVRTELSILACLLALGHMIVYLLAFIPRLGVGMDAGLMVFIGTAVALMVLLAVLGVTSLGFVKRLMDARVWKSVQRWAYVFFGLIYVHLVSILLVPAMAGGQTAQISVAVYTVLMGAYAVLRIRRVLLDRRVAAGASGDSR